MRLSAANRLLIPFGEARPDDISQLLSTGRTDLDGPLQERILDSHLITQQAADALRREDRVEFLRIRQESVRSHLESFLDRMAEWDYEDTPALDRMDLDEEDEELAEPDIDFSDDRLR